MACCTSQELREQRRINDRINDWLRKEKMDARRIYKLLLLGTGESGKSTFLKQMKIIHGQGFSMKERRLYITIIRQGILMSIKMLVNAMDDLKIQYENSSNTENAVLVRDATYNLEECLETHFVEAAKSLWKDSGVQECFCRRMEYHLTDSAKYFFEEIDRIAEELYLPTDQDILHARSPTTGIVEYVVPVDTIFFRIVDVGGQRTERKKWIHCFEKVTSIIFLAALSDYDQGLVEDKNTNRLKESVALYRFIISSQWFKDVSVILFMNKKDLLEEKIIYSNLEDHFPAFEGPKKDSIAAREYILSMFINMNEDVERLTYTHFTCATDTQNMRFVFAAVKDSLLTSALNDYFSPL